MSSQEQLDKYLHFLETDPHNVRLLADIANCAYNLGQFEVAERYATTGLTYDPDQTGLLSTKALSILAMGHPDEASKIFKDLMDAGENDPALRYNLAYCYALINQYDEALAVLADALDRYVDFPQMLHLKMRTLYFMGDLETALQIGQQAIESNPNDAIVHELMASLYIDESNFAAARHHADLAIRINPNRALAHTSSGTVALGSNDDQAAQMHFNQALDINPKDGRAWLGKALTLMLQKNLSEAESAFHHAIELMPSHLGTYQALAWCQITQHKLQDAENTTKQALAIDDTFSENHGTLAVLAVLQGNHALAKTEIRTALGLDKNSFSGLYAQALQLQTQGDSEWDQKIIDGMLDTPGALNQQSLREFLMQHMQKTK